MALIKCVECGNEVSTTAKTCPKCGAKVTVPSIFNQPVKFDKPIGVGRWAMALVVFFLAWSVLKGLLGEKKEIPPETKAIPKATVPFKVTAQLGLNVSVLVAKGTSESDLREVVFELSCARRENRLQALGIGPTTLGGVKGPYFVVQVYVFDDPDYASAAKRNQFIESDDRKDRTFSNSVREKDQGLLRVNWYH